MSICLITGDINLNCLFNDFSLCNTAKKIQPVHPKGDQSWVFTGRTDAEAETPIPWPSHAKS